MQRSFSDSRVPSVVLQALEYAHTFIRILQGAWACVSDDLLLYVYWCRLLCLQFKEQEETRSVWPCWISNDVHTAVCVFCLKGCVGKIFLKIFWLLPFSSTLWTPVLFHSSSTLEWHRMHELCLLFLNSNWYWTLWPLFDVAFAYWKKNSGSEVICDSVDVHSWGVEACFGIGASMLSTWQDQGHTEYC